MIKYIGSLAVLLIMSLMYEKYKKKESFDDESKQYELVRKYLLNHSSLAQSKKPILWIHMNYEINARSWSSFGSRNNDHLNQPYIFLTIKSIIDKCGNDFNICIIDDSTFGKILPGWTIDLNMTATPIRCKLRELALARVLHSYGGIVVPRSFICLQNLKSLYDEHINESTGKSSPSCMFVGDFIDRHSTSVQVQYFPNSKIMGCEKNCPVMAEYIQYMEKINSTDFTEESHFTGGSGKWFYEKIQQNQVKAIGAERLGMKDSRGKPITVEMLLNDSFIDVSHSAVGVYVPEEEILKRSTYQWFPRLSTVQVLDSSTNVGKLLLVSGDM
jgi:hypothetical protein